MRRRLVDILKHLLGTVKWILSHYTSKGRGGGYDGSDDLGDFDA